MPPLRRPRCRWKDNIKMDLQKMGCPKPCPSIPMLTQELSFTFWHTGFSRNTAVRNPHHKFPLVSFEINSCRRTEIHTTMQTTNKMQQLFRLLIFLNQPYMFRAKNSPILRSTFGLYIQLLVQWTVHCTKR